MQQIGGFMIEDYEDFSQQERDVLGRYVTNTKSNVFALKNLPEVIKGALFSKYSRSTLGLRALLLKEFILQKDSLFSEIASNDNAEEEELGIQKATEFYDRILDGYGDDSIGELGGAHLAIENISMLAAKVIEDCRIGGSPLEKSTRYIYFDQKRDGEYLFYREPILMTSAFRDDYVNVCNYLFEVYGNLIPELTEIMEQKFPKEPNVSKSAYGAAIRAKVLDCLRGLLPTSALTNMGFFGNGRFCEGLLQKLQSEQLSELSEIGKKAHQELSKVIPSFVRRGSTDHRHFQAHQKFKDLMLTKLKNSVKEFEGLKNSHRGARLIDFDENALIKVASALIFPHTDSSLYEIEEKLKELSKDEIEDLIDAAAFSRENRRHKSPRALERAFFTFEITADFGSYRDLQRHRILTQDRQLLTCDLGYYIPDEILNTSMEKKYRDAMDEAKRVFDKIRKEFPEEAQYVVPMAYNIRWYFHINLRSLQWLTELRSTPQGHPSYRKIAQEMAHQVMVKAPEFKRFLKFVDFEGYDLGRLDQEIRKEEKIGVK
jgi:thymidylate synthase ThyX